MLKRLNKLLYHIILNDQIPIKWLDGGHETFKVECKELFLKM